jgi:hypothetical protein
MLYKLSIPLIYCSWSVLLLARALEGSQGQRVGLMRFLHQKITLIVRPYSEYPKT